VNIQDTKYIRCVSTGDSSDDSTSDIRSAALENQPISPSSSVARSRSLYATTQTPAPIKPVYETRVSETSPHIDAQTNADHVYVYALACAADPVTHPRCSSSGSVLTRIPMYLFRGNTAYAVSVTAVASRPHKSQAYEPFHAFIYNFDRHTLIIFSRGR
jgi:hypothetical protein